METEKEEVCVIYSTATFVECHIITATSKVFVIGYEKRDLLKQSKHFELQMMPYRRKPLFQVTKVTLQIRVLERYTNECILFFTAVSITV